MAKENIELHIIHNPKLTTGDNGKIELEKQSEQKSADKVEPKFHEGDWVVRGDTIAQILDIHNQSCRLPRLLFG